MVKVYLHSRVADDEVSANEVSLRGSSIASRKQKETVRIPNDRVILYDIVVDAAALQTYAEVVSLGRVAIST